MAEIKSLLVTLLMITGKAKTFYHNRHHIMTPNNGQGGSIPPSQGNINEIAMFPPLPSNNLAPDNNDGGSTSSDTTQTQIPPAVPTFTNDITPPDIPVETSTTAAVFETVTTSGGTIIQIELPSSIHIYVNIMNNSQATVEIPPIISSVEISTAKGIDTSTVGGSTVEQSTISGSTVEQSTVSSSTVEPSTVGDSTVEASTVSRTVEVSTRVVSDADRSIDLTTVNSTLEMFTSVTTEISQSTVSTMSVPTESSTAELSTVKSIDEDISTVGDIVEEIPDTMLTASTIVMSTTEMSTTGSTVETSTADITVEMSTAGTTVEMSTAESTVEMSTAESTVEMSTAESTVEVLTTESVVKTSTTDSLTVDILTESDTNTENNSLIAPTINESSTEAMRYIQININLSDNNQNGNFGFTTQPSVDNLGQLQNKMIFKRKCDEYYASSRVGREAKVTVFIVGGTSSTPKEFPHMAALGYGNDLKKEWLCGGSLISENYVITAAHCLSSKTLGNVQVVRLGTTLLNTETLNSEDYRVTRRIPHPAYVTNEQYNDIALLQLDRPVTFTEYISPICLYSSNLTDEVLIATGWGKTESTGDVSPELQKVELEYFPNIECQTSYSGVSKEDLPRGIVAETQICAGSRTEEKDTCQGDSGGPLQIKENGRMYLLGITSFGIACGQLRPGVYTKVSYYIPWIERIVWESGR